MKINWKLILKILTGFIIIPTTIWAYYLWPWWMKTSIPIRLMSAIFVLPIIVFVAFASPWWDSI